MHIPDGVLSGPVLAGTSALAIAGVGVGLARLDYERIPRVGVLASVFFVVSLVHVPIGPSSAHLVLVGLMGLLLGWAVFPALAAALLLQKLAFGFGGLSSIGANTWNMGIAGVACSYLFARGIRPAQSAGVVFALAFVAGMVAVLLSAIMVGATLYLTGEEFLATVQAILAAHVVVMVVEGFVTASAVGFLHRVRPEFLEAPLLGTERQEESHA